MSEEQSEIQKLLRLKRYEQPRDGYFEEFLTEFQSRQRSELLQRSARSLLMERVGTYFSGIGRQRWFYGAGLAYATVMLGVFAWRSGGDSPEDIAVKAVNDSEGVLWNAGTEVTAPVRFVDGAGAAGGIDVFGQNGGSMVNLDTGSPRRRVVLPTPNRILPVSFSDEVITREY